MSTPILATKLYVPPPRSKVVLRPHLIERLNESLTENRKLTLISAPAGFGKTTLVSEWVKNCRQPVAWLSLDEGDNDLASFLTYMVAALQTVAPKTGEKVLGILQAPQSQIPPIESILPLLLNEITTVPDKFVLVLDDYHMIDSKQVDAAITFLLENLPPQMHLVIATREDPNVQLARLRARGQMTELRAVDLRFTPAEAAEFLNRAMGLNLSTEDIAALENRTEGWIAGLQLAALSVQDQKDITNFIKSFTGSHRFVLDYLLEEVLQHQSESVQHFLLHTSVLDRMCGPLCDAVLLAPSASSQETLEYLEHSNLFIVPLDNERHWYRYHHLFGDLLRKQLGQSLSPDGVAELHTNAAEWFEKNVLTFESFRHAAAAGDIQRAERLIESEAIGLHLRSVAVAVLNWLASLPEVVLDSHPLLWVRSATLALMAGQTTGIEAKLQSAEKALSNIETNEKIRDLSGQIACARATIAFMQNQPEIMNIQAQRALELLHPDNLTFLFTANWALASALMFQGDRVGAARACQEGVEISQKSGHVFSKILANMLLGRLQEMDNQLYLADETYRRSLQLSGDYPLPNASAAHLGLARISYEWNDLYTAEQHGQQSLQLTRQFNPVVDQYIVSEVILARVKLARGESEGAVALLVETEKSARQRNSLPRLREILDIQVQVLIRQNRLSEAAQMANQYELPLSRARVLIAQDNSSAALAVLESLRRQMETRGWADERLKIMVIQSVALYVRGEKEKAVKMLSKTLTLAQPGGFIRLFIDEGAPMAQLLFKASSHGIMPAYINRLLAVFETEKRNEIENKADLSVALASRPLIEPLSQRELEILRLIAQGLSNREISERRFLALSTVKGHNRIIFDKLQVQSRTEAVAKARGLGLL